MSVGLAPSSFAKLQDETKERVKVRTSKRLLQGQEDHEEHLQEAALQRDESSCFSSAM